MDSAEWLVLLLACALIGVTAAWREDRAELKCALLDRLIPTQADEEESIHAATVASLPPSIRADFEHPERPRDAVG